jgi:hypothetical protein
LGRLQLYVYPNIQISNRTIRCILNRSARLCGDCMEPDYMAKYSLPMLTDLTGNIIQKKKNFFRTNPLTIHHLHLLRSR